MGKTRQELIDIVGSVRPTSTAITNTCSHRSTEFKFIGSGGSVTTREQGLAGEASSKKSTSKYEVDDAAVWLDGRTAVVTGRVTIRKTNPKAPVSQSRFTDVFVYRDHRWQLVAGHSSTPARRRRLPNCGAMPPAAAVHGLAIR
jgi:hypothetical protein